jgi:hypothetical protein
LRWSAFSRYGAGRDDDRNAAILHFSALDRPWLNPETPGAAIFWKEAELSPACEAMRALLRSNLERGRNRPIEKPAASDRGVVFGQWLTARECRARLSAYGLSGDEKEGTWIVGERLTLYALVDRLPRKVSVSLEGFTVAPPERAQVATLSIAGSSQTTSIIAGQTRLDLFVEIPERTPLVGGCYLGIEIRVRGFVVPAEEGWSNDIRTLRFFLQRIKIEAEFAPSSRPMRWLAWSVLRR